MIFFKDFSVGTVGLKLQFPQTLNSVSLKMPMGRKFGSEIMRVWNFQFETDDAKIEVF